MPAPSSDRFLSAGLICTAVLFVLSLTIRLDAQVAKVTGTVVDKAMTPKSGCIVTLIESGITATTGSDGKFDMATGTGTVNALAGSQEWARMNGTFLQFTASANRNVKIAVFNAAGVRVAEVVNGRMPAGRYTINPFERVTASGIYLVRIVTDGHQNTFVVPRVGARQMRAGVRRESSAGTPAPSAAPLAKSAVTSDILSIECDGIWQKSLDVTASTTDLGNIKVYGKPNFIHVNTDDQSYWESGLYGNPVIKQPNLDTMALRGVVFKYAYNPSNICQPSRACLMLSQFAGTHRSGFEKPTQMTISRAEFAKSYPVLLRKESGYKTAFMGKFGFAVTEEKKPNIIAKTKYPPSGMEQLWWHDTCTPDEAFDFADMEKGQGTYWPDGKNKPHLSAKIGTQAIDFIREHKDEPFLVCMFDKSPHTPYNPDPAYANIYNGVSKFPRHPHDAKKYRALLPAVIQNYSRCRSSPSETEISKRGRLVYGVDVALGRVRNALDSLGLLENTVIIYTSDNGYALGAHGCDGKDNLYDGFSRVPFIIIDPRMAPSQRGKWVNRPVMSLDIGPTLLEMTGVTIPSSMFGTSLLPIVSSKREISRESIFQENYFVGYKLPSVEEATPSQLETIKKRSWRAKAVRTERYHYIRYHELDPVVEELFDVQNDTLEINNVIKDTQYADVLEDMRKKCDDWMKLAEDARIDNK